MYGQNLEDKKVYDYFCQIGISQGKLLDIGANDGSTFSNSLYLIQQGWEGLLLEPSPVAFKKLQSLHGSDNPRVFLYNLGIANQSGKLTFYDSGSHLPSGTDISLVSSAKKEELLRWQNVNFTEIEAEFLTFKDFETQHLLPIDTFDFISIDAEGYDLDILKQINLIRYNVKCICIEWNSKKELLVEITSVLEPHGYGVLDINAENVIFVKK